MEPNTIEESIKGLLEAIKESPDVYKRQQKGMSKNLPELWHRY